MGFSDLKSTLQRCWHRSLFLGRRFVKTSQAIDDLKMLTARSLIGQMKRLKPPAHIHESEFRVFSQFGDDGIIQYLIDNVEIVSDRFVEFGVGDYTEANTRFLLMNNNWSGLVLEYNRSAIDRIRHDEIYWKYDLTAVQAFVNRDNINHILAENSYSGEIGLLSIDVDGNDYWIWDAIEVVEPTIVIIEYNSVFGNTLAITIPYDPQFDRARAHQSLLYWGASLRGLCSLADRKGYAFVGCNSNGNNAYFLQKDRMGAIRALTPEQGYVKSKFNEIKARGEENFVLDQRLELLSDIEVYDVENNVTVKLCELLKQRS